MLEQTFDGHYYICSGCQSSRTWLPPAPPDERVFPLHCRSCNIDTVYYWQKDDPFHAQKNGWRGYMCDNCGVTVSLPDTEKKRKEHVAWQEAGCPPPWWFRPAQLIVLSHLIVVCFYFPWWMLGIYCGLSYSLIGWELASGRLICSGAIGTVMTFLFAVFAVFLDYFLCFTPTDSLKYMITYELWRDEYLIAKAFEQTSNLILFLKCTPYLDYIRPEMLLGQYANL